MKDVWIQGGSIARWNVSAAESRVYPGRARTHPDAVTYRFENGWVDTGDLPCREALRKEVNTRVVELPELSYPEVYLSGAKGDVDYSAFCHVPEWRVRHARVRLESDRNQTIRVRVKTAGAVHLWRDNKLVLRFEPFVRNDVQDQEFELEVAKGAQQLTVRFEDLHERDTNFGFGLELIQGEGLSTQIESSADPLEIDRATALLDGLRTEEVFHDTTRVSVTSEHLQSDEIRVYAPDLGGQGGILSSAQTAFFVTAPAGCSVVRFNVDIGDVTLSRTLGMSVMPNAVMLNSGDFNTRARSFLQRCDCGDDIVATLLAVSKGHWTDKETQNIEQALIKVRDRHDCADFRMMSLLWIWDRHRQKLPEGVAASLKEAILGFRYWMDEPGNDVMWFWSENHVLCFHIAQHLAGEMFSDEIFAASGRTGSEQSALGAERLHKWFDAIDLHGLAEWNSAAYYPINYRGLLALFTLARDQGLKARAKKLLDQISKMVALHMCGGVAVGSQGRIYEKELLAGPMTELGAIGALMFGGWHVPGKDAAAILLAISDYRPSPKLSELAWPDQDTSLRAQYCQGLEGQARLKLFKTADVQLSSVTDHQSFTKGHQQHVVDAQFANDPLARSWINHPGTLRYWSEARPSYWAGNGRLPNVHQSDNTALLVYDLMEDELQFTQAFLPVAHLDENVIEDQWIFARSGDGYAAVWSATPFVAQTEGLYAGHAWKQNGARCGWVLQVGSATSHGSFTSFKDQAKANDPRFSDGVLSFGSLSLSTKAPRQDLEPLPLEPRIEITKGQNSPWMTKQDDYS